jgi:hypothetical protein
MSGLRPQGHRIAVEGEFDGLAGQGLRFAVEQQLHRLGGAFPDPGRPAGLPAPSRRVVRGRALAAFAVLPSKYQPSISPAPQKPFSPAALHPQK